VPVQPTSSQLSNMNNTCSAALGSTSVPLGNRLSTQTIQSNPFQLNSTTSQPNALSLGSHVDSHLPVSRGFMTSSSTPSLPEKPLFGNSVGAIFGTKSSETSLKTKLVTRDDFTIEAKIVLKKQQEALRAHSQGKHENSATIADSLEGGSLVRILTELTATTEKNENAFRALLGDVRSHSDATITMKYLKESTTNGTAQVKSLNESFTRKKHSVLCLFDSITSALSLLKKDIEPLFLVFYDSEDMDLARELGESNDVKKSLNLGSNIGALADAHARAARVKRRWSLLEKFESIFIQLYNLMLAEPAMSSNERVSAQEMPASEALSVGVLRRIVDHNFQSLFSIWRNAAGIFRKKDLLEKTLGKYFRVVI